MFGELIGLWCAHEWDVLGKPAFHSDRTWARARRADARHAARNTAHRRLSRRAPIRVGGNERPAARRASHRGGRRRLGATSGRRPARAVAHHRQRVSGLLARSANSCATKTAGAKSSSASTRTGALTVRAERRPCPRRTTTRANQARCARSRPALEGLDLRDRNAACTPRLAGRSSSITATLAADGADTLQALKSHNKVDPLEAPAKPI